MGCWEDMGLYWAWRGGYGGYCKPPTKKCLLYEHIPLGQGTYWMSSCKKAYDVEVS